MHGLLKILLLCNLTHSSGVTRLKSQSQPISANSGLRTSLSSVTCLHDWSSEFSVTAYPGSSCAADVLNLIELSPKTPYPLSCPSTPRNNKCFPITEKISTAADPAAPPSKWADLSDLNALSEWQKQELRRRLFPSSRRRQRSGSLPSSSSSPTTINYKARSVSLTWPDEMTHAVFFVDDGCEYLDDWRQGEVSHVQRRRGGGEQCVAVGLGGVWGSVEFMREEEWVVWRERNS